MGLLLAEGTTPEELAQGSESLCGAEARANATAMCTAMCGGDTGGALAATFVEACIYDVCHAGQEAAISDCLMALQAQTAIARTSPPMMKLVGEGCCKPWDYILANIPNLTKTECAVECASNSV